MQTAKLSFQSNPNIGLYGYCTSNKKGAALCLLGETPTRKIEEELKRVLRATIHHLTIAGTPMPGVFLAGNKKALLIPDIAFPSEEEELKSLFLPVKRFRTTHTCLGNNIIANDDGCLVNPELSDSEIAELERVLGVPVKRIQIAGIKTPGACIVLNGKYGVIHRDAAEHEIAMVKSTLKLERVEPASISLGSPYLKAGILNNEHGLLVSETSGGPEIVHLEESLGYLKS